MTPTEFKADLVNQLSKLHFSIGRTVCHPKSLEASTEVIVMAEFLPNPICSIWFRWTDNRTIEICNCYVPIHWRRLRIMSFTFNKLVNTLKPRTVTTPDGSIEGGAHWLRARGFRMADAESDWTLKLRWAKGAK